MNAALEDLLGAVKLRMLAADRYQGDSRDLGSGRIYGGQLIGQGLAAALHTVEGKRPHSLHAYFQRAGAADLPVEYQIERFSDGRSFSLRSISASQQGRSILTMMASFHAPESGMERGLPMPLVPAPEALPAIQWSGMELISDVPLQVNAATGERRCVPGALEFRQVPAAALPERQQRAVWFRVNAALPDDAALHEALLAYLSDFHLLAAVFTGAGMSIFDPACMIASLDHALWFHRAVRCDQWLLYLIDCPVMAGARGQARGLIYRRDGALVSSAVQEGLMRRLG